jgi:hypothetical protein
VAKTGPIEYLCNPVDGAKIDALIADLYRMPKNVVDATRVAAGLGAR